MSYSFSRKGAKHAKKLFFSWRALRLCESNIPVTFFIPYSSALQHKISTFGTAGINV
jgi:hypothetical protein